MEIITRKEAMEGGLDRYFTGKLCIHGHCEERKTSTKRCVQCNRDHVKQWGRDNPDKVKARNKRDAKMIADASKKAKLKKPEKYKALRAAWLEKNKDRHYAAIAVAKKRKPEKYRALHAAWSKKNPEKVAKNSRLQQSRRRAVAGSFARSDIERIFGAQRQRCAYFKTCGIRFKPADPYHLDHILAVSKGGTSDPSNIQILCPDCNRRKGSKDAIVFMQSRGLLL